MPDERFVHVLLFQCPTCSRPIAAAENSPAQNVEDIDAARLPLNCRCGWSGASSAVSAKRHWVAPWELP